MAKGRGRSHGRLTDAPPGDLSRSLQVAGCCDMADSERFVAVPLAGDPRKDAWYKTAMDSIAE